MMLTLIGVLMFLMIGIIGIVTKELIVIFFGFGLFLMPLHYLITKSGRDFFIENYKNNILYGIFYILGSLLIISGIVCLIFGVSISSSSSNLIKQECLFEFNKYDMDFCIDNFNGVKACEKINATCIKTEGHLFSSWVYICEKNGEIIRI